jgi:Ca2+-transporting ATPase
MILTLKPLRSILRFAPLELADLPFLFLLPVLVLLLCEIVKGLQNGFPPFFRRPSERMGRRRSVSERH